MRVLEASDLQPVRHNCTACFILTVQNVTDRTEFAAIPAFSFCSWNGHKHLKTGWNETNDHESTRSIPTVPTRPKQVKTCPNKSLLTSKTIHNQSAAILRDHNIPSQPSQVPMLFRPFCHAVGSEMVDFQSTHTYYRDRVCLGTFPIVNRIEFTIVSALSRDV